MFCESSLQTRTSGVPHYGEWTDFNTYELEDVQLENLLDLTDNSIIEILGTQYDDLVRIIDDGTGTIDKSISYELTNVISKWARESGYNGLIVPGARGTRDYQNIVLFNQSYIDEVLESITPNKINK